ncbi:hypothetical protein TARUN_6131 [Trichoderma arundinaceum]|uniref:Uncharacterized protein n=1 Tax=Trichoderma arundinaceum TaxID=490622 RepID=A0A395NJ22_TRIAR|nr:hypothetical protein TARUN_6131 [Trichoderma arundinaceum]
MSIAYTTNDNNRKSSGNILVPRIQHQHVPRRMRHHHSLQPGPHHRLLRRHSASPKHWHFLISVFAPPLPPQPPKRSPPVPVHRRVPPFRSINVLDPKPFHRFPAPIQRLPVRHFKPPRDAPHRLDIPPLIRPHRHHICAALKHPRRTQPRRGSIHGHVPPQHELSGRKSSRSQFRLKGIGAPDQKGNMVARPLCRDVVAVALLQLRVSVHHVSRRVSSQIAPFPNDVVAVKRLDMGYDRVAAPFGCRLGNQGTRNGISGTKSAEVIRVP